MNYTRTMPQPEMERFLIICRELDDLTDQLAQTTDRTSTQFIVQQIGALRNVRDDIAGTYPWTPAA